MLGLGAPLRIGIWLDDLDLGLRAALKQVGGWSLEAAGLDAFGAEVCGNNLSGTGRREVTHLLRSAGLRLLALRADVGGRRLTDEATLDSALGRIQQAFGLARDLGAPLVVVPLGFVPAEGDEPGRRPRQTLTEALQALQAQAASFGVRPVVQAGSEPPGQLAAFLEERDRAGLMGVDLHPGGLLARAVEPLKAFEPLGARICLATAVDHYRGGGEAVFGKGDVPWGEVVVALSAVPGPGVSGILAGCGRECDRLRALAAAVEQLKKLRLNPLG